mmetsp:Transcript_12886/g.24914  ORF Transcript_12886/g.24914 Transcript_12886/m.24914 type:complete len:91 (-) Transcript_12886:555-827(-)
MRRFLLTLSSLAFILRPLFFAFITVGCDYGPGFVCVVTAWLFVSIAIFVSYFALLLPSPQMTAERVTARTRTTATAAPSTKEQVKTVEHL